MLLDNLPNTPTELSAIFKSFPDLALALDLRDRGTFDHTQRVAGLAIKFARWLGLDETEVAEVQWGALLHDIGKMAVPDEILLKPGPLTAAEWDVIRRHPRHAFELLSPIPRLGRAIDIPHCHHEKWDGTGYPQGLKEHQIPLNARLFAVVDVYDALTSNRSYRPAWPRGRAIAYITDQKGKHFDPRMAGEFLRMIEAGHP